MRIVIADLKGRGGFVNKDTVVGGYGSRFQGFSWTTRWIERVRKLFQNVPSIHSGYLAAILEQAGHDVRITTEEYVDGDVANARRLLWGRRDAYAGAAAGRSRLSDQGRAGAGRDANRRG